MHAKLAVSWAERKGGGGKTYRRYLDILIDGKRLQDLLGCPQSDFISPLGWGDPDNQKRSCDQLLLRLAPDLPSRRVMLLVCPECADLGCGAYTVRITKDGTDYVWGSFALENDERVIEELNAGPFHFRKEQYYSVIAPLSIRS